MLPSMKLTAKSALRWPPVWLMLGCVSFSGLLLPTVGYPDTAAPGLMEQPVAFTERTPVNSPTIDADHASARASIQPGNPPKRAKTVLVDRDQNLSAFFIAGIMINVIMAVTFAWWFSREWRKSGKQDNNT